MDKKSFLFAAATIVTGFGIVGDAKAQSQKMEKCFGIVKAGLNDCANATGTHSCATLAKKDADTAEWLLLPEGTCEKIVGGVLEEKSDSEKENEG